jgi:hypothetical protein
MERRLLFIEAEELTDIDKAIQVLLERRQAILYKGESYNKVIGR